jgi:hypothetical protein
LTNQFVNQLAAKGIDAGDEELLSDDEFDTLTDSIETQAGLDKFDAGEKSGAGRDRNYTAHKYAPPVSNG